MKWPLRKKQVKLTKDDDAIAVQHTRGQLKEVRSRWPEVNSLVARLGTLNRDNHYTELVIEAMRGGKK